MILFPHISLASLTSKQPIDLLVIAGEHSGDEQAARYIEKLKKQHPEWHIVAFGGKRLQEIGIPVIYDMTMSSVVGFWEVIKRYPFFIQLFKCILNWIILHQPKRILLVDYPGFNLRLAEALKERQLSKKGGGLIRVYYYISPQIWAWKKKRRFNMAQTLDGLAVIFPFEIASYTDTNLPVYFVGHPFMDDTYHLPVAYNPNSSILLLPGSRKSPVKRIFPLMLAAIATYLKQYPQRNIIVLYPSKRIYTTLQQIVSLFPNIKDQIQWISNDHSETIQAAAVLTSSGTMSLNCALAGIPGAIVYKAAFLTYWVGRWLIQIPYLGIANLLLNQDFYPEFIQQAAKPQVLANEIHTCLTNASRIHKTQELATRLRQILSAEMATTMPIDE